MMNSNEIDEKVLAKLKVKILKEEQDNAKTQAKKSSDMVDFIYTTIKNEVHKALK
ncbi:hypothetical protein [Lacrimispora saccharolytica]|uniref:hypothetical protein n=1 Tax=Lacrimispora saccharolytica TaxID=84030 RepID=UPI00265D0322|nr:hypothetical protein [Lacrimispora saccharolytica]MCF2657511.1 hypothetical protein [Lacrimispora saccharolytica]